jgi:hypothetical protein
MMRTMQQGAPWRFPPTNPNDGSITHLHPAQVLEKENARLQAEVNTLKKAATVTAQLEAAERKRLVAQLIRERSRGEELMEMIGQAGLQPQPSREPAQTTSPPLSWLAPLMGCLLLSRKPSRTRGK